MPFVRPGASRPISFRSECSSWLSIFSFAGGVRSACADGGVGSRHGSGADERIHSRARCAIARLWLETLFREHRREDWRAWDRHDPESPGRYCIRRFGSMSQIAMSGAIRDASPRCLSSTGYRRSNLAVPHLRAAGRGVPLGRDAPSGRRRTEPCPARRSDRPRQLDLDRLGGTVDGGLVAFGDLYHDMWFIRGQGDRARAARREPSNGRDRRRGVNFQNTAQYGPLLYAPQTIGILLGRSARTEDRANPGRCTPAEWIGVVPSRIPERSSVLVGADGRSCSRHCCCR